MLDAAAVLAMLQATDERSSSKPRELTITSFFCSDMLLSFLLQYVNGVIGFNQQVARDPAPRWKIGRCTCANCSHPQQLPRTDRVELALEAGNEGPAPGIAGIPVLDLHCSTPLV
jgi:hypothetical protein